MIINNNIITADDDKLLKRKSDGFVFGKTITLGYTYFINGIKLSEPKLEVPEDFEEIDKSEYEKLFPNRLELKGDDE